MEKKLCKFVWIETKGALLRAHAGGMRPQPLNGEAHIAEGVNGNKTGTKIPSGNRV